MQHPNRWALGLAAFLLLVPVALQAAVDRLAHASTRDVQGQGDFEIRTSPYLGGGSH